MSLGRRGARAYEAASDCRNLREQEADVFRRATGALRFSLGRPTMDQARALADNRRLWTTVVSLMRDPENPLPKETRAGIVSIGLAVQREMETAAPDINFLIAVNENITSGLSGQA